jgi:chromosome segregation ATPase
LVSKRTYGSALNECEAWKQRAVSAENKIVDLLAENGVLEARVEHLAAGLGAAKEACEHLEHAAGVVDGAQVLALQKELAQAREQIARQNAALEAYERDHQGLLDDLRRLAEQRDEAVRAVERLSHDGGWTPEGASA